ncbi:MAG: xanthine dehydrogenase family protein molybdopterin-binding subunit [Alphaproteobacteria bacterium]
MGKFAFGQSIRRREDARLLTGDGRYADDINLPQQSYAYILRSPHAHARIRGISTGKAKAMPGVLAVFTGADLARDGIGTIPLLTPTTNRDGSIAPAPPYPCLAQDRARYVGDAVALVVGETLAAARDAAEEIEVDYSALPAWSKTAVADAGHPARIWDEVPGNLCFDWEIGDRGAAEKALAAAPHRVKLTLVNNRLVPNPMEPRAALGAYERGEERYVLYTSSQGSHFVRELLAKNVFKVPENRIRVVTPDVGGGFGAKIFLYREHALVLYAARKLGRPVKWTGERSDCFLADTHGRDNVSEAELGLDRDGRFLAMRVATVANLGAYLSNFSTFIPTLCGTQLLVGVYVMPAIHVSVKGVFTNTAPVDAYRGAGRPEAAYVIERMVDHAARKLGIPPDELRRRNFIAPAKMPYATTLGLTYDSGDFARNMEDALKLADAAGFPARKAAAMKAGKRRGLGFSTYIEQCGGGPNEAAEVRFDPSGSLTLLVGTQASGQGHQTAYAQILAEALGVPFEEIRVVQGDSDQVAFGRGTGGSRSLPVGGAAVDLAAKRVIERGKPIAAHLLEASAADIEFRDGRYRIAGTDRSVAIAQVAEAAFDPLRLPPEIEPGFGATAHFTPPASTFPNGCHLCELEVDPETGTARILRYLVVDDVGVVLNPLLLDGQIHGGVVQGIGQALLEACVYDAESGQLVTGSLMDYCMPRADDVPAIESRYNIVPCRSNPLGVKGAGEAGAIGAPPAVINALVDALAEYGIEHIDMPATPERIWKAITESGGT